MIAMNLSEINRFLVMIEDTDAPGQKVAETRQVVPAKYNHRSTLKIVLDVDHAESVDFNLDAR